MIGAGPPARLRQKSTGDSIASRASGAPLTTCSKIVQTRRCHHRECCRRRHAAHRSACTLFFCQPWPHIFVAVGASRLWR